MANGPLAVPCSSRNSVDTGAGEPLDRELLRRFVRQRDEAAFAALVSRHGPMVLGVCRRVLRHQQDAEDVFQATFLLLARKADSLRKPELLGNWLYGVAYRTALQARAKAARRSHHESEAASMSASWSEPDAAPRELRELLDQELARLPEKYRAPLVLCYLEGKTNEEAARLLGWPLGSMSTRLARGRELLRDRLMAREPDRQRALAVLPLLLIGGSLKPPLVPATLAERTVTTGISMLGAKSWAVAQLPPAVEELMNGPLHTFAAGRRWVVLALLGLITASVVGSTLYARENRMLPSWVPFSVPSTASCH